MISPVVLYTGLAKWSAAQELAALIQASPPRLRRYQPQQRYLLIDQGLWAQSKDLPHSNLTALLFLLEHSTNIEQAQQLLRQLDKYSAPYRELRTAVLSWLRYVYFPRVAPELGATETLSSFDEVHTMLELDPRRWGYKERMEGREEGLEEGKQKGLEEGKERGLAEGKEQGIAEGLFQAQIALLSNQLQKKFGLLPISIQQRITTASYEQREAWALQLLDAQSLEELFGE